MKKENYQPVLCNEIVFENDDLRVIKRARWDGCRVCKDEGVDLLRVLFLQEGESESKYTFAFCDGKRATDLEFDYLEGFKDGLALMGLKGKGYGYIDENINSVIAPKFYRAKEFKNGFAKVSVMENGKERCFCIDKNGKELIFENQNVFDIDCVECVCEGLLRVSFPIIADDGKTFSQPLFCNDYSEFAGKWGFFDANGKEIVKPQYIFATDFEYGLALVCKGKWEYRQQWDKRENTKGWWSDIMLWGVIDKTGKEVIPCIYDEIDFFWDSRKYIKACFDNWKWGIIDCQNNVIVEPKFEKISYEFSKDDCFTFYSEYSFEDVPMGIYSIKEQKVLFEPQFNDVNFLDDGDLIVEVYDEKLKEFVSKIIDRTGKEVFKSKYSLIRERGDFFEVHSRTKDGKALDGLIDKKGNEIFPCKYEVPWNGILIEAKRVIFEQGDKYGVMDFDERIIIPAKFHRIYNVDDEFLKVCLGDENVSLKGLFTQNGEEIFPAVFESICCDKNTIIARSKKGSEVFSVEWKKV